MLHHASRVVDLDQIEIGAAALRASPLGEVHARVVGSLGRLPVLSRVELATVALTHPALHRSVPWSKRPIGSNEGMGIVISVSSLGTLRRAGAPRRRPRSPGPAGPPRPAPDR